MSSFPAGTVSFLFSDIEGSTRHWQDDSDGMRRSLALHDEISRAAIAAHAGHVLKHTGDGLVAVFATATDAIAAAVDAQRAFGSAEWGAAPLRVRMGVHTGDAERRDGDYFGPTLNRAARLMATAHAGQILVSSAAAGLAREGLADAVELINLGEHLLRDLDRPERVFQIRAPGIDSAFPPLRSVGRELRAFPVSRTAIVGREKLLARIAERLATSSLVTLTGVGGSGKTRLGVEAGRQAGAHLRDGAAFVDLAPLGDATLIAATVAAVVGVPDAQHADDSRGGRVENALIAYLADREMLIVLDNCEHLIDGCAYLADRILAECGDVKILATSREGLAVDGECTVAVPSLELPRDDAPASSSEAVRLLTERVSAARSDIDLLGHHEAAVVEICKRLDGIPLAIELAAAQIAHSTPEEVAARLGDRFRLLSGGRRRVQRQSTLQATVDWSYDLLSERERVLLARLGVFAGDFSMDAVAGICGGDGIDAKDSLSLLASLVAKSLLLADTHQSTTRYRLLETIRIYAEERLFDRGEAEALRDRHRDWFLELAERTDSERLTCMMARRLSDLRVLLPERDNFRVALAWCEEGGRSDLTARIAVAVDVLWIMLGAQDEGLRWLDAALAAPEHDLVLRARCLTTKGWVTMQRGDFRAMPALADAAVAAAEGGGLVETKSAEAYGALALSSFCLVYSAQAEARRIVAGVAEIADRIDSDMGRRAASFLEFAQWLTEGNYDRCCAIGAEWTSAFDRQVPGVWDLVCLGELVVACHLSGRHDEAVRAAEKQTEAGGRYDHLDAFVGFYAALGPPLARTGTERPMEALPELIALFENAERTRAPVISQYIVTLMAIVLARCGDDEQAATVLSSARATGDLPWRTPGHYALYQHYRRVLKSRLGDEVTARCHERGGRMALREAVELARSRFA
jgi:predicted ATPase/class 3 adenylate cyclase